MRAGDEAVASPTRYTVRRSFLARVEQVWVADMPAGFDPDDPTNDGGEVDNWVCDGDLLTEDLHSIESDDLTHTRWRPWHELQR